MSTRDPNSEANMRFSEATIRMLERRGAASEREENSRFVVARLASAQTGLPYTFTVPTGTTEGDAVSQAGAFFGIDFHFVRWETLY